MEEATTKQSEDEIKFDEVHAYLSKREYLPFVSKAKKFLQGGERKTTNWLMVRSTMLDT